MSVKIPLDNKFVLMSDQTQWILGKIDGNRVRALAFFCELENLIKFYLSQKMRDSNATSMFWLIETQKRVLECLNQALAPLYIRVETGKDIPTAHTGTTLSTPRINNFIQNDINRGENK